VSLLALTLVLLQTAAATPAADRTPTPAPTPTPTPRPVSAGPRTLQDVARDLRLGAAGKGKGSLGTVSGPSTASAAPKPSPEAGAAPEATPEPEVEVPTPSVRVTTVSSDGIVDAAGGVRVNGTVRNGGFKPACNVVIAVKILDNRGSYLASAQATPDIAVIPSGEIVSFHTIVQAPPGVRGARMSPDRKDATEGSTTLGGDWRVLGGTDATVASASEDCAR
jgi:hypothetical protein